MVGGANLSGGTASGAGQPAAGLDSLVAQFRAASVQLREECDSGAKAPGCDGDAAKPCLAKPEDVAMLSDMCGPDTPREFVVDLLEQCGGRLQDAAAWVCEAGDLGDEVRRWKEFRAEADRRAAQEAKLLEKDRKRVVERFAHKEVSAGGSEGAPKRGSSRKGAGLQPWQTAGHAAAPEGDSKVRYRDGQVVSRKGEKFIVEKVTDDWDGGSRGKVFTKGKRGKGFT
ncbi:unnamed protein product [Pedinophyceae sp. YPF-701]|nr:unnamed protein product [Pedinophyceae sp. YPF-701]